MFSERKAEILLLEVNKETSILDTCCAGSTAGEEWIEANIDNRSQEDRSDKEKREGPISDLEMEKPSNPSNFSLCRVFLQHLLDDPTGGYSPLNNVFTNKDCPCKMHSQFDSKKSLNVLYHNR